MGALQSQLHWSIDVNNLDALLNLHSSLVVLRALRVSHIFPVIAFQHEATLVRSVRRMLCFSVQWVVMVSTYSRYNCIFAKWPSASCYVERVSLPLAQWH